MINKASLGRASGGGKSFSRPPPPSAIQIFEFLREITRGREWWKCKVWQSEWENYSWNFLLFQAFLVHFPAAWHKIFKCTTWKVAIAVFHAELSGVDDDWWGIFPLPRAELLGMILGNRWRTVRFLENSWGKFGKFAERENIKIRKSCKTLKCRRGCPICRE